jgi:two-component system, sensor histidine kinase
MTASGYALVAKIRFRELKTRLVLAVILAGIGWVMAPSIWPAAWLAAVLATQGLDLLAFRSLRSNPEMMVSRRREALLCAVVAMNVVVYSSLAAYLWFEGGDAGRVFAMIQAAGGLLHVSLHMHHRRVLLLAAATPHALYLLGLPLASAIVERDPGELMIAVGGLLYLMHLVVSVKQTSATIQAMGRANTRADEARQAAEVASAAKSDFLAVISHEIRTPMNAVISAANLLRRSRLDADQREHVAMLMDAGDVMMGLLNDVLDFAKIEAGRMTLDVVETDVEAKLNALRRLWEPKARANGVRLVVAHDPAAPELVGVDPLRLQQILFNLTSNAVKFTRAGRIDIETHWDPAGRMTFRFQDTGIGIPADRLETIFASFQQAEAGTTRRFGGTGLGLTISRRLAELMGGTLTVESEEGRGSVFTLTLPVEAIDEDQPRAVADTAVASVSLQGRSILAADDHEVNRRILALLLEPHGCRLTFAVNGAEAVEAAGMDRFDAILMDMQMPVMDGLEATKRIRSSGPNAETPVIALTANAMEVHRAAWDAAGVHAFLTKPIDPALLARTLAEAAAVRLKQAA